MNVPFKYAGLLQARPARPTVYLKNIVNVLHWVFSRLIQQRKFYWLIQLFPTMQILSREKRSLLFFNIHVLFLSMRDSSEGWKSRCVKCCSLSSKQNETNWWDQNADFSVPSFPQIFLFFRCVDCHQTVALFPDPRAAQHFITLIWRNAASVKHQDVGSWSPGIDSRRRRLSSHWINIMFSLSCEMKWQNGVRWRSDYADTENFALRTHQRPFRHQSAACSERERWAALKRLMNWLLTLLHALCQGSK